MSNSDVDEKAELVKKAKAKLIEDTLRRFLEEIPLEGLLDPHISVERDQYDPTLLRATICMRIARFP